LAHVVYFNSGETPIPVLEHSSTNVSYFSDVDHLTGIVPVARQMNPLAVGCPLCTWADFDNRERFWYEFERIEAPLGGPYIPESATTEYTILKSSGYEFKTGECYPARVDDSNPPGWDEIEAGLKAEFNQGTSFLINAAGGRLVIKLELRVIPILDYYQYNNGDKTILTTIPGTASVSRVPLQWEAPIICDDISSETTITTTLTEASLVTASNLGLTIPTDLDATPVL